MSTQRTMVGKGQNIEPGSKSTIRFDMKSDDMIRSTARRGYEIAKRLKDVGIKFKKILPASIDPSVRKQFRLPVDSDLICIELNINKKTDDEKQILAMETKDQLLMLDSVKVIDEGIYIYDASSNVYRILIKYGK